jgi:gluconate kinase
VACFSSQFDFLFPQRESLSLLAGSGLKKKYRAQLLNGMEGIEVIYLKGNCDLIWSGMSKPEIAFVLDVSTSLDEMIDKIVENYLSP